MSEMKDKLSQDHEEETSELTHLIDELSLLGPKSLMFEHDLVTRIRSQLPLIACSCGSIGELNVEPSQVQSLFCGGCYSSFSVSSIIKALLIRYNLSCPSPKEETNELNHLIDELSLLEPKGTLFSYELAKSIWSHLFVVLCPCGVPLWLKPRNVTLISPSTSLAFFCRHCEEHFTTSQVTKALLAKSNLFSGQKKTKQRVYTEPSSRYSDCTSSVKYDQDKPIAGALQDMGLALLEVSKLLTFGAKKYKRGSWLDLENGYERYTDALNRHFLLEKSEDLDEESGLGHDVAVAVNALFRLELRLRAERTL